MLSRADVERRYHTRRGTNRASIYWRDEYSLSHKLGQLGSGSRYGPAVRLGFAHVRRRIVVSVPAGEFARSNTQLFDNAFEIAFPHAGLHHRASRF